MAEDEKTKPKKAEKREAEDTYGLAALGALVVFLGVVVYLAVPKDSDLQAAADAGTADDDAQIRPPTTSNKTPGSLERLPEASCELAVLTDKPEVEVAKVASVEVVAKLLDVRHCGATCDALRKVIGEHDHFEVEVTKAEDYILPARDSFEIIAPGLTVAERASITQRASVVVIRTRGTATIDQLPARTCFASTAAIAEMLSGLVYDEAARRIETAALFAQRVVTLPMGQNVFSPRHITVQLYRQEDGTARLLTLGMVRFGSPDFTMRGSAMEIGPSLANVMNGAASWAAGVKTEQPIVVSLAEVARVSSLKEELLAKDPRTSKTVQLDAIDTERIEGDPENEMLELVPTGPSSGATREAWANVVADLFGAVPQVVFATNDKELDAIAARARRELGGAVKRWEGGEGTLFVKGPFPIPFDTRIDGGAKDEWMWIEASSCDAKGCSGLLSNTPGYATNMSAGKPVTVAREKTADWLLRLRDGGTAGGESIRVLGKRP